MFLKFWLIIAVINIILTLVHVIFVSDSLSEKVSSFLNVGFYLISGVIVAKYYYDTQQNVKKLNSIPIQV